MDTILHSQGLRLKMGWPGAYDSAEAALEYWSGGAYTASGVFVFGGNGSTSLLAFDLRVLDNPVVEFDPIDPEGSMARVADNFEALLELTEAA